MTKPTDQELIAALEAEESQAIDGLTGDLAQDRTKALDRYRGKDPDNVAPEGRSNIVSRDVTDTIESIMPSLTRVFFGGDELGKFEPRGPEDEQGAKQETDVCNWFIFDKNDGFQIGQTVMRDALLLKNGYAVAFWKTKTDVMSEVYVGKTDDELAMLQSDPEVEIVEHTAYPDPMAQAMMAQMAQMPPQMMPGGQTAQQPTPMLHDVKIEYKKAEEYVAIEAVPPDELLVSRHQRTTSLLDSDFVEWKRRVTIGQLRAEGFDVDDDVFGQDDKSDYWGQQQTSRERYLESQDFQDVDSNLDPSRRLVTFRDAYWRVDATGSGKETKLWRMARVAGTDKFAYKAEVDSIPFAAFTPLIYPHSHVGTSEFDLIDDVGQIKTQLQRNLLDGQYSNLSGRKIVDVNRANIDDFLIDRPNAIYRVDGDPNSIVAPYPSQDTTESTLTALQYMDGVKLARTGVSGAKDSLEPNTLNKTATGVQAQQANNNMRVELIARTMAGGFRDLFLIVHALALKHSTKPLTIKLRDKWVTVNPREWKRRTDFTVSVGLGTGTPEAQMAKLMGMAPAMQAAQAMGLMGPDEVYNVMCELWKAAGYKVYSRFLKEPQKDPQTGQSTMPPPPPDPAVQVAQIKQQGDMQRAQGDMQLKLQELDHQFQLKQMEQKMALELQQSNDQRQSALDQQKHQLEMVKADRDSQLQVQMKNDELGAQYQRERDLHMLDNATKLEIARISAAQSNGEAMVKAEAQQAGLGDAIKELTTLLSTPKTIVRDSSGKATGIARQVVKQPKPTVQ